MQKVSLNAKEAFWKCKNLELMVQQIVHSILGANVTQLQMTPLAGNISNVENKKQFREPVEKFSMELWTLRLRVQQIVHLILTYPKRI